VAESQCDKPAGASCEKSVGVDGFTRVNTHAHLDHICNNGLIAVVETKTKHHYLLCGGIDSAQLDAPGALRRAVHPDGGNLRGNLRSTVELPDRPLQVPVYDRFRQLPNRLVARK